MGGGPHHLGFHSIYRGYVEVKIGMFLFVLQCWLVELGFNVPPTAKVIWRLVLL